MDAISQLCSLAQAAMIASPRACAWSAAGGIEFDEAFLHAATLGRRNARSGIGHDDADIRAA